MRMKGIAHCFDVTDTYDPIEAVLTDRRLSLDFEEEGESGHLEATSTDGKTFRGSYGYPQLEPGVYEAEFDCFRSVDGDVLFIGRYRDHKCGEEGGWLIRLRKA